MKKTLKFVKEHKQFTFFGILAILIILAAIFAPVLTGGVDEADYPPTVILGYATLSEEEIREGVRLLAQAWAS